MIILYCNVYKIPKKYKLPILSNDQIKLWRKLDCNFHNLLQRTPKNYKITANQTVKLVTINDDSVRQSYRQKKRKTNYYMDESIALKDKLRIHLRQEKDTTIIYSKLHFIKINI